MQALKTSTLALLITCCAHRPRIEPQPASAPIVDKSVTITPDNWQTHVGWHALSERTVKAIWKADIDRAAAADKRVEDAEAKFHSEEAAHKATRAELERAQWWEQHGMTVMTIVGVAAFVIGGAAGLVVGEKLAR